MASEPPEPLARFPHCAPSRRRAPAAIGTALNRDTDDVFSRLYDDDDDEPAGSFSSRFSAMKLPARYKHRELALRFPSSGIRPWWWALWPSTALRYESAFNLPHSRHGRVQVEPRERRGARFRARSEFYFDARVAGKNSADFSESLDPLTFSK